MDPLPFYVRFESAKLNQIKSSNWIFYSNGPRKQIQI